MPTLRLFFLAILCLLLSLLFPPQETPARDRSQVRAFLRSQGLTARPEGYEVDHIIPLCAGGADSPENMQLLTREQHREKTRHDLRWCYKLRQAQKEREGKRERERP